MDAQYGAVERRAITLGAALTVLARMTSDAVPGQVVVDAGTKALSTDPAQVQVLGALFVQATHRFMGDEHSALEFPLGANRPAVGTQLSLIATHCDPTVNLHGRLHVIEHGRLIDIWPLEARGY